MLLLESSSEPAVIAPPLSEREASPLSEREASSLSEREREQSRKESRGVEGRERGM